MQVASNEESEKKEDFCRKFASQQTGGKFETNTSKNHEGLIRDIILINEKIKLYNFIYDNLKELQKPPQNNNPNMHYPKLSFMHSIPHSRACHQLIKVKENYGDILASMTSLSITIAHILKLKQQINKEEETTIIKIKEDKITRKDIQEWIKAFEKQEKQTQKVDYSQKKDSIDRKPSIEIRPAKKKSIENVETNSAYPSISKITPTSYTSSSPFSQSSISPQTSENNLEYDSVVALVYNK